MSCPDMPEPLCLVKNTDTGLVLNESTVRVISQITTPVVVVSVVGPYRTGKSYLLNRLMGRNNGFALGSTIQSKTKGIWVWCRQHPRKPKHTLVLLDTEGLSDVEKGDSNNDNHMFALATLMSSTLVYNNLGTLQNEAIDKLHFVSELTELIKVKSTTTEETGSEFAKFFPDFVWTVRDFTLELDQNGRRITPDQYLDMALTLKTGKGKRISDYNLPRECIRNFFKKLKCFVFDRPVQDASLFKVMETLTDKQLDRGFLAVADEFCNYVFENSLLKTYLGKSLNGSSIGSLLGMYLETIRSGRIPCMESAFDSMAKIENQKAVEAAFEVYREVRGSLSFPTKTQDELSALHQPFEKRAVEKFLSLAFDDKEGMYQDMLKNKISEEYSKINTENEAASEKICEDILKSLSSELDSRLSNGTYLCPGGYNDYTADKARVVNEYNTKSGRGVRAQQVLEAYLRRREAESQSIMAGDKQMTENEKDMAAQRQAAELAQQKEKAAQEENEKMARKMQDDLKSHNEHLEQLKKKTEDERAQLKRETNILLEQQMTEQRKLLEEGFKRQADEKQNEIDSLRQQMEKNQSDQGASNKFMDFLKTTGETLLPVVQQYLQFKTMSKMMRGPAASAVPPTKPK